uniref:Sperm microtubule associated protein 2 n=1 Tax=Seriola lalandi dorsalis TaxID=1841481 RepID=A0A3B4YM73_SERLL
MATQTHQLAQPKPNRLRYPDRSVYWLDELPPEKTGSTTKIVSEWALRAVPSKRLHSLAQPRVPAVGWQPDRQLLAPPKHDHPKFEGERSVCWPVSRAARSHVASHRLLELSTPKERKALFEGYNPYVVSRAARSASPSPRIQQLCVPLPRKC